MSLSKAMKAVRKAQECVKAGEFGQARDCIILASELVKKPHSASLNDAYETTDKFAHLGECQA